MDDKQKAMTQLNRIQHSLFQWVDTPQQSDTKIFLSEFMDLTLSPYRLLDNWTHENGQSCYDVHGIEDVFGEATDPYMHSCTGLITAWGAKWVWMRDINMGALHWRINVGYTTHDDSSSYER